MNGVFGQENVDNSLDIEFEVVDEPTTVIDQNLTVSTECPGSVHSYLVNTTRELFLSEIMPEIKEELDQKDQEIIRMNNSINELTNTINEIKAQLQVRIRISKTIVMLTNVSFFRP